MADLKIKLQILDFIKQHGKEDYPVEACGYLAGKNNTILKAIKMKNIDNSSEHFSFDIKEQFKVLKEIRKEEMEILGVYHTHPNTYAYMSDEDLKFANDINFIYLIYSIKYDDFKFFKVTGEKILIPLEIEVIE